MISIDDFKKSEIRIGRITSAEKVADADKLLKLSVDFGEDKERQIISGIALYFPDPSVLVGIKCPFVINLEPRVIRGLESQGMIMAATNDEGFFTLLKADPETPVGLLVK